MQEFQGKVLRGKRTSFGGNSFFKIVVLGGLSKSVEEMNWLIVYSQLTFCSVCKFSCRNSIYIKCRKYLKPFSDKFIFILVKINPTLNLRSLFVTSVFSYRLPMEAQFLYFIFYLHHSCLYLGLQYTPVKWDSERTLKICLTQ